MKIKSTLLIFFITILFFLTYTGMTASEDYLKKCWAHQAGNLNGQFIVLHYEENNNRFYHSPEPWQVISHKSKGTICFNEDNFFQNDTITDEGKFYISKTQFGKSELLLQPFWSKGLLPVTSDSFTEELFEIAGFSPVKLLNYFINQNPAPENISDSKYAVYKLKLNETIVKLFIRKSDCLLEKIITKNNDDILGDLTNTLTFTNYEQFNNVYYAKKVVIDKIHDVRDDVTLSALEFVNNVNPPLEKPKDYTINEDEQTKSEVNVEKFNNNIYFLNFPQAGSRAILIEFKNFFVILDVPLNSENGELVLKEAKRINPVKPVRYYAFDHHHPWYIGGVRPFIRTGATVLCRKECIQYLQFIASAQHTLKPDSLQFKPRILQYEMIDSIKTITDGNYEMVIYHIGNKSKHTSDYSIFYFPSEKLLIEGDLAWIPKTGPLKKGGPTQKGLYQSIKDIGLDVKTIVQAWPITDKYSVKSVFDFNELEESIILK